jgi:hypothetical protein
MPPPEYFDRPLYPGLTATNWVRTACISLESPGEAGRPLLAR